MRERLEDVVSTIEAPGWKGIVPAVKCVEHYMISEDTYRDVRNALRPELLIEIDFVRLLGGDTGELLRTITGGA